MRKNKILIIDDNVEICDMIELALETENIEVDKYNVPKVYLENMNKYSEENLDLIIIDIMMPEIDGLELLNILNNNINQKNIPKIILTSYNTIDNLQESYDKNAILFLNKPINISEFIFQVKTLIRLKKYEDYYRNIIKLLKEHNKKLFNEILSNNKNQNDLDKNMCKLFNNLIEISNNIDNSFHIVNILENVLEKEKVFSSENSKKIFNELKNIISELNNKRGEIDKVYDLLKGVCSISTIQ